MVCTNNKYINFSFGIIFQVTLIAIFLSVFFFLYVSNVEKEEFKSQINFIVDHILSENDIKSIIPSKITPEQKAQLSIFVSGAFESAKTKTKLESKDAINSIINNNNNIKNATYTKILYTLIIVIVFCVIVLLLGFCLPIVQQLKEALIVVFFVALTELLFLQIVAKNYISADPNKVKAVIASSIKEWLQKNPDNNFNKKT